MSLCVGDSYCVFTTTTTTRSPSTGPILLDEFVDYLKTRSGGECVSKPIRGTGGKFIKTTPSPPP